MADESRSVHPKALPNYKKADIPRSKLEGYALDPAHTYGQHKARVFKSALGFDKFNWQELAQIIHAELPYYEAIPSGEGQWGKKYEVTLTILGLNGNTATVLTVWIIRPGTDYPSLVTTMVVKEKR